MFRRILYAFGHDDMVAMTRLELKVLAEIHRSTHAMSVSAAWSTLYQKALFDCALSVSGYAATSREQMLSPDPVAERDTRTKSWSKPYRQLSAEERAFVRLERQKIEIVTLEVVPHLDGAWFSELCGDAAGGDRHIQPVARRLIDAEVELSPEIVGVVTQFGIAA
jgi:hypothetical protein